VTAPNRQTALAMAFGDAERKRIIVQRASG